MKKLGAITASFTLLIVVLLIGAAPHGDGGGQEAITSSASATMPPTTASSYSNCLAPPKTLSPTVPSDMAFPRQADANCFAWSQFIALNWVASAEYRGKPDPNATPATFGEPLDRRLTVWETYKLPSEVFLPDAKAPAPWNSWPTDRTKLLGQLKSKFDPEPPLDLSEFGQASMGHPWLTAQNGKLTMYEMRMNEDEFNYVVQNKLYNAYNQAKIAQDPGFNLPDGTAGSSQYGTTGSIETKAAWVELTDTALYPKFKIADALVKYPGDDKPRKVVVGLVGLHIIHKTGLGQQFIWATFEHVGNCPSRTDIAEDTLLPGYTYYNAKCDPKTDYYKCKVNFNPTNIKCGGKDQPKCNYAAPNQIVRENPLSTRLNNNVVGLNEAVWDVIAAANKDSVYLNYQLVNTLWATSNTPIPAGSHTPLTEGDPSPGINQEKVTNTTLETYVQTSLTCLSCHTNAPIAKATRPATLKIQDPVIAGTPATSTNPYASDYSFLMNNAKTPPAKKK